MQVFTKILKHLLFLYLITDTLQMLKIVRETSLQMFDKFSLMGPID